MQIHSTIIHSHYHIACAQLALRVVEAEAFDITFESAEVAYLYIAIVEIAMVVVSNYYAVETFGVQIDVFYGGLTVLAASHKQAHDVVASRVGQFVQQELRILACAPPIDVVAVGDYDLGFLRDNELLDLLVFGDSRHLHCLVGEHIHLGFYFPVETDSVGVFVGERLLLLVVEGVVVVGSY